MLATIAAAAMAGVPLLNGFLSKEMFFAETIEQHVTSLLDDALPYLVTLAAMFSVTYSLRFIYAVFFVPPPMDLPQQPPSPPSWMLLPVALLDCACLMVGIFPAATAGTVLRCPVRAGVGPEVPDLRRGGEHGIPKH